MKFSGIVKKHLGRGRRLGYPTANIDIDADAEEGVFVGYTSISPLPRIESGAGSNLPPQGGGTSPPLRGGDKGKGEKKFPSLIFIGAAETFGDKEKRLESHILDFSGDLYDQEVEVEIVKKLRDNIKFESEATLVEQMKQDEFAARQYFGI